MRDLSHDMRTYVSVTLRNVAVMSRWNVAVSPLVNSECHMCACALRALAVGAR